MFDQHYHIFDEFYDKCDELDKSCLVFRQQLPTLVSRYFLVINSNIDPMGITKTEGFNESQVRTANLAKALGHPARIAILEQLLEAQPCICGDLVDVLPLSQATVSQHLRELKNVGLINGTIDGPRVNYRINDDVWAETKGIMTGLLEQEVKDSPEKTLASYY